MSTNQVRVGWRSATSQAATLVTSGLTMNLDASNSQSYSGTGTTWTDLSGNSKNATLLNGVGYASTDGGVMTFDGVNDYIRIYDVITDGSVSLRSEWTINIWFKETTNSGRGLMESNVINSTGANGPGLYVLLSNGNLNTYNVSNGYSVAMPYYRNGWNYITISRKLSSNEEKVYLNGNLYLTRTTVTLNSERYLNIGVGYHGFFNGSIGSVTSYNKVLTDAEVKQNFEATKTRFGYVTQPDYGSQTNVSTLLDNYTGAAVAYSLRKLKSSYTGSAIRVRRSIDNAEKNIGFNSSGALDTTDLEFFIGAGNAFVVTWYDQSGNGLDAIQNTASLQPQIASNGSLIKTSNNIVAMSAYGKTLVNGMVNTLTHSQFIASEVYGGDYSFTLPFTSVSDSIYSSVLQSGSSGSPFQSFGTPTLYVNNSSVAATRAALWSSIVTSNEILVNIMGIVPNGSTNVIGTNGRRLQYSTGFNGDYRVFEVIIYNSDKSASRFGINENINSYYSIYTPTVDADAQAFITAASISSSTQQSAVNKLVNTLKDSGVWTKLKAIYPFVGGSAASHKFNLKDPRDLDAAHRLVFNGGWTHTATGALPNGTTAYANTNLIPNTIGYNIPWGDSIGAYLGIYSRTNGTTGIDQIDMGALTPSNGQVFMTAWTKGNAFSPHNNKALARYSSAGGLFPSATVSDSRGWYSINRLSNSNGQFTFDKNNVAISSGTAAENTLPNIPIYLSALNNNGSTWWCSNREISMSIMGSSITDNDKTNLYNAVQTFQNDLGRAV
jgi:hypothetical protein